MTISGGIHTFLIICKREGKTAFAGPATPFNWQENFFQTPIKPAPP